ncbi:MAG: PadR family transcriptional regulator, regulatory protein PadR [Solirubrobacteraceae bacterium]|jgi:DNA-binding PadR family transcriptional regulator|nr:PadR family transcriptional regulator, regulatory protein PadR [Solirubrobacteraceae bacterium]
MRKDSRTGWLLLLIRAGPGHGYELRHALRDRALEVDRAVMYRSLREMEQMGWISSRWASSRAGPRRRVYDITATGLQELDRIAREIELARDAHDAFLQAYRTTVDGDA